MDERTRLIRSATRKGERRRTVNPPIERATTLLNPRAADLRDSSLGPVYGIEGLGVHRVLEEAIAEIEGARHVFLVPTGLAAVTVAASAVLRPGDEALVTDAAYGPTRRYFEREMKRWGVGTRFYPAAGSADEILALAGEKTRMLHIESPGSVTFDMVDAPALASGAKAAKAVTLMDNTWAAGVFFKPLAHGVDLSVQALSKYVGGHSDVFLGSIATNDDGLARRIANSIEDLGWYVSPDDCWLALRGVRTLPLRLAQHFDNARRVADWLAGQPQVARVLWPALPASPHHALWKRDYTGASGLMGVVLKPGSEAEAEAVLDRLELFGLGYSWGGFESLATHETPQLTRREHQPPPAGPLLRLHVGLEAPEDLIADLERGLKAYPGR
jgi:cystathionine beta-lyase